MVEKTVFTDTHCHLYAEEFNPDRETVIQAAIAKGVERLFLPNVDLDSIDGMESICRKFPKNCFPMIGLHPCSVQSDYKKTLSQLKQQLDLRKYVAIGEIGIDLYWDKSTKDIQIAALEEQINWAEEFNLPIVLHTRESINETINIIRGLRKEKLTGVFHCFSGTLQQAEQIIDMGFYLGIGGVVTFKNATLAEIVKSIPISSIVLETDAPYLAPVPFRGKRNESGYILEIASKISEIKGINIAQIAKITTENSVKLFGI